MEDDRKYAIIDYTNHRGERVARTVEPRHIWFGRSPYHDGEQWFLQALDVDKGAIRDFAMGSIHSWWPGKESVP